VPGVVTVAVPVRDGLPLLDEVLAAVRAQHVAAEVELLVADSGSRDGSVAVARRHGAEVLEIAPETFSHGGTRNDLMRRAAGGHVAFLTQDATPAGERWLAGLLGGFERAADVALAFGPYRPRPDAPLPVRRELEQWFGAMASNGGPTTVRLERAEREVAQRLIPQARLFFSDANGCVARAAWEEVPFRDVPYAEDRLLAADVLAAGYAKVFVPDAAVLHSHHYPPITHLRRCFDEWRALREVSGYVEPLDVGAVVRAVREDRALGVGRWASVLHHAPRALGAVLGSRADRLPASMRRRLSLEGRA
jgi:glycosyltransferase involved in cell wall biosynthesis